MSGASDIHVLHVDDDLGFADVTAEFLERQNERFVVETASGASEGLDYLTATSVDGIVSDYDMPGMDGLDFLEAVREEHPDLPFILFTGKGSEEVASEAVSAGVTDYMQKENGTDQYTVLANRIVNSVDQYRAEKEAEQLRQQMQELAESTTDCLWMFDCDWEDLLFISGYEDVWGRPESAIKDDPKDFLRGTHPDDRDRVRNAMDCLSDGDSINIEYRILTSDDEERWVWAKGHPVFDDEGNVVRVVGFTRDITERKERERQHAAIIENADVSIYIKNREGEYQLVNDAFATYVGQDKDELVGAHVSDVFDDEGAAASLATDHQVIASGESVSEEVVRSIDGEDRVFLSNKAPYRDANGDIVGIVGISRDITRLKQQKRQLEQYETIVETIPEGVFVIDDGGIIVDMYGPVEDLTGFARGELLDTSFEKLVTEGVFTAQAIEQWQDGVRSLLSGTQEDFVTYEVEATPSEGDARVLEVRLTLLPSHDGFDGTVGVARDITERKNREDALEQLHDATRNLMAATTTDEVAAVGSETATNVLDLPINGIHLYDADSGNLVPMAWSEGTESFFDGPPPALPVGDSLAGETYQTGEPHIYADVREADARLNPETDIRSELHIPIGEHGVFVAGSETPADFDTTDETLAHILAANIETALDRVKHERELQRQNDRLDEFVSVVSHDLRNPLNVAQARVELAQDECDSPHLDNIAQAHDRMETLIDDLLTLAREGEQVNDVEAVDLGNMSEGCWRSVKTNPATLNTETTGTIRADPGRLKQLLENLFRNAVDHGGESVTVIVGDLDDENGFYIKDDGPGTPAEDREQIFEMGYTTTEDGTGFGLNIVQEIAEAHGWTVRVTESEAGGARFEITGVETVDE